MVGVAALDGGVLTGFTLQERLSSRKGGRKVPLIEPSTLRLPVGENSSVPANTAGGRVPNALSMLRHRFLLATGALIINITAKKSGAVSLNLGSSLVHPFFAGGGPFSGDKQGTLPKYLGGFPTLSFLLMFCQPPAVLGLAAPGHSGGRPGILQGGWGQVLNEE